MNNKKEEKEKKQEYCKLQLQFTEHNMQVITLQTFTGAMLKLEMLCSSSLFLHSTFNPDAISWRQIWEGKGEQMSNL